MLGATFRGQCHYHGPQGRDSVNGARSARSAEAGNSSHVPNCGNWDGVEHRWGGPNQTQTWALPLSPLGDREVV